MNSKNRAPCGTWESIISPSQVCSGSTMPWETKIEGDICYWTEQRPLEGGRAVILRWSPQQGRSVITPPGYNVRTRVYVYGGSAFCVKQNTIYFVNDKDFCIYSQKVDESETVGSPQRLTDPSHNLKFAELCPFDNGLLALTETSDEKNSIAFVDGTTGSVTILVEGADFYSSLQVNPENTMLAWLEWNHPNMPWDEASLWVGTFQGAKITDKRKVAGNPNESVSQPVWNRSGNLGFLSDRTGWWNLYEWNPSEPSSNIASLCTMETEFGVPQWRFNTTWGYSGKTPVCAYKSKTGWSLGKVTNGKVNEISLPFNSYSQIKVNGTHVVFMAGSSTLCFAIYVMDLQTGTYEKISEETTEIPQEWISVARPVTFPTNPEGSKRAYGFFYPPTNPNFFSDEAPPVIVKIHGGPTGAAEVSMRPMIQFWTSRGFALFDVDYTGSTGYGREYRDALKGEWGIADRDDILWGVRYLIKHGWVNPDMIYISGSSAGGFTLLRALTADNIFTKAVCYYGVSDLEALATETHKFEKHYLDQLIAPYPEKRNVYLERSPINAVDKIRAELLIFQGLDDKVVPPDQSRLLFESLQKNGVNSQLVEYEGEGHGFRQSTTLLDTLERELQFLQPTSSRSPGC